MPRFEFDFEVTTQDRLLALEELLSANFARPLYRWLGTAIVIMWIGGSLFALRQDPPYSPAWAPYLWFLFGCVGLYRLQIQPLLFRSAIRRDLTHWERVLIDANDDRMIVTVAGRSSTTRQWSELTRVFEGKSLLVLFFSDGSVCLIPNSAFDTASQRDWFTTFLDGRRLLAFD